METKQQEIEVKVDFSEINKTMDAKFEKLERKIEEGKTKVANEGKGLVERLGSNSAKLLEQLQNVARTDITEQWTVVIPAYTTKEIRAHLRDFVRISDDTKGKAGDTVNHFSQSWS